MTISWFILITIIHCLQPACGKLVSTIAGRFTVLGDGGPAQAAQLNWPNGLHIDPEGDIFIADGGDNLIRRIFRSNGTISSFAGGGGDYWAEGLSPRVVGIYGLGGVTGDTVGAIYYTEDDGCRVRRIANGTVRTIGGEYQNCSHTGDGTPAINATFNYPYAIVYNQIMHALFVAESNICTIRMISLSTGIVSTVSGGSCSGSSGAPIDPILGRFEAVADIWMSSGGTLFIADAYRLHMLASNLLYTLAGDGVVAGMPTFTSDMLNTSIVVEPTAICGDDQHVYFIQGDDGNHEIIVSRINTLTGQLRWIGGFGGDNDVVASNVSSKSVGLGYVTSCKVDPLDGSLLLTDASRAIVWRILNPTDDPDEIVITTVVGYVANVVLPASSVLLWEVYGMWADPVSQDLYLSDDSSRVHRVSHASNTISVFAGTGLENDNGVGQMATATSLNDPRGIVGDGAGNIFIAERDNNRILSVNIANGITSTLVQSIGNDCEQELCSPYALAYNTASASLYVSDDSGFIRVWDPIIGLVTVVSGIGYFYPRSMWVDGLGNLFMADYENLVISYVDISTAQVSVVAGDYNSDYEYYGEGVNATAFSIPEPWGICGDGGDVFLASPEGSRLLRLRDGELTTLLGNGETDRSQSIVNATAFTFQASTVCLVDPSGMMLFSDEYEELTVIRQYQAVDRPPTAQPTTAPTFALPFEPPHLVNTFVGGFGNGDGEDAPTAVVNDPKGIFMDSMGNLYVSEFNFIRKISGDTGIISTIVGGGAVNNTADGLPGVDVYTRRLWDVAGNTAGDIFYSDQMECRIRRWSAVTQTVATVAGMLTHCMEDTADGLAGNATVLIRPRSLHFHVESNTLYYVDGFSARIRAIDMATGIVTTVLGAPGITDFSPDGTPAVNATASMLFDLWVNHAGDIYYADSTQCLVRMISHETKRIITIAGSGNCDSVDISLPANESSINYPTAVCGDLSGNVYFNSMPDPRTSDGFQFFRVDAAGTLNLAVGDSSGTMKASGMDASAFELWKTDSCLISEDMMGQLMFAEGQSNTVWRVMSPSSIMDASVYAVVGYVNGATVPAHSVHLTAISGMWMDPNTKVLFLSEANRNLVHRVIDDEISIFAGSVGTGLSADGVPAISASLASPQDLLCRNGVLYIADMDNHRIRAVDLTAEQITTAVGTGQCNGYIPSAGSLNPLITELCFPRALARYGPRLYIADASHVIWQLSLSGGDLQVAAGTGASGYLDGPMQSAQFTNISSMWFNSVGGLYVVEAGSNRLRVVDFNYDFEVSTIGGDALLLDDPMSVCGDGYNAFIADNASHVLKLNTSILRTAVYVGNGEHGVGGEYEDALSSPMATPGHCLYDMVDKYLYFAEHDPVLGARVRRVTSNLFPSSTPTQQPTVQFGEYVVNTIAGYSTVHSGNGDGDLAQGGSLSSPAGVFLDSSDNIYIIEEHFIRRVDNTTKRISTVAGGGSTTADNALATNTEISLGKGIAGDHLGNLFYSDADLLVVRRIDAITRQVTTIAGDGNAGFGGDDGPATEASLYPHSLFYYGPTNTLYVADFENCRIRAVSLSSSTITTVVGCGYCGSSNNLPVTADIGKPSDLWMNAVGEMFIAEEENCMVRKVPAVGSASGETVTFAGLGECFVGDIESGVATSVAFSGPVGVCGDSQGNIIVLENSDDRGIRLVDVEGEVTALSDSAGSPMRISGNSVGGAYMLASNACKVDSKGNVVLVEGDGMAWRIASPLTYESNVTSVVGYVPGVVLPASSVSFPSMQSICISGAGDLFIADDASHVVHLVESDSKLSRVIAGTGRMGYNGLDAFAATLTALINPRAVVLDSASNLYIADQGNYVIRKVEVDIGIMTAVSGNGVNCDSGWSYSGPADGISWCDIQSMALFGSSLFVSDWPGRIRVQNLDTFQVELYVGSDYNFVGNIPSMTAIGEDSVYFVDDGAVKLTGRGALQTIASNGTYRDGARLPGLVPDAVCAQEYGFVFIVSSSANAVYAVRSGQIHTIAGNGSFGVGGEGDFAAESTLSSPGACAVDRFGRIYFAEQGSQGMRIRQLARWSAPSSTPSSQPSQQPVIHPTSLPTSQPTAGPSSVPGDAYVIDTVIGQTTKQLASRGDGGIAKFGFISFPQGIFVDSANNYYFAEYYFIRKIAVGTTILSTVVGGGASSDENALATDTSVGGAVGVAGDSMGNIYYSESNYYRVRKVVKATGRVVTVVGGAYGFSGDGGPATAAKLASVQGIFCFNNTLYIADIYNYRIRAVDLNTQIIITYAGTGETSSSVQPMDNVLAINSKLTEPSDIWVNSAGDLFIVERSQCRIRKVNASTRIISTVAGTNCSSGSGILPPRLNYPMGICGDAQGNLYVTQQDYETGMVMISSNGSVHAMSNTSNVFGMSGKPVSQFKFRSGYNCKVDMMGSLVFTEGYSGAVWVVDGPVSVNSTVNVLTGTVTGVDYPVTSARLTNIRSMWQDPRTGDMYALDASRWTIRKATAATQMVSIYAGGGPLIGNNITATAISFGNSWSIVGDSMANIYIGDNLQGKLRKIDSATKMVTILNLFGSRCASPWNYNGPVDSVGLCGTRSLALFNNTLFIAEQSTAVIRRVSLQTGWVSPAVGNGVNGFVNSVSLLSAMIAPGSASMYADTLGNLYLWDLNNKVIRYADFQQNRITTIAGGGLSVREDIPATEAAFYSLGGICGSDGEYLYVAVTSPARIRAIKLSSHFIHTIAGNGTSAGGGENEFALNVPISVGTSQCVLDSAGHLYFGETVSVSSTTSSHIRRLTKWFTPTSQPTDQPSAAPTYYNQAKAKVVFTLAGHTDRQLATIRGDGGPAVAADISLPSAVHIDSSNNYYIGESSYLRKVDGKTGIISTLAGGGVEYQNLTGTSVKVNWIYGITSDTSGNIFFSDRGYNCVRQITLQKTVRTVAGQCGSEGRSTHGVSASASKLDAPCGIFYYAPSNTLFIAEFGNCTIRSVDLATNAISIAAGNGSCMQGTDNVLAFASGLRNPTGVFVNHMGMFIADSGNYKVRLVDMFGIISTYAGNGVTGLVGNGGPAPLAGFSGVNTICGDSNDNLFIATSSSSNGVRVHKVDANGIISYFAGGSSPLASNVPATSARMNPMYGCAVDHFDNLILTDRVGAIVWKVSISSRIATTLIGYIPGVRVPASALSLTLTRDMWIDNQDNVYLVETGKHLVHVISQPSNTITIFAGTRSAGFSGDSSPATAATFSSPIGLSGDGHGNIYIADYGNNRIRMVAANSSVSTIAGTGGCSANWNYTGPASSATLCNPTWLVVDPDNKVLYFSDLQYVIRQIDLMSRQMTTIVGSGVRGYATGVSPHFAPISNPVSLWLNGGGNLFFVDNNNMVVQKVNFQTNLMQTVAGGFNGTGSVAEDIPATSASLLSIAPSCGGLNGDFYVTQLFSSKLRLVSGSTGKITTFVGAEGYGVGGELVNAATSPVGTMGYCHVDSNGDLYYQELVNGLGYRIRKVADLRYPTSLPSGQPSEQPTGQPTRMPSGQPSRQPSSCPSGRPSGQPSRQPFAKPSSQPTRQPSRQPTRQPSSLPSTHPTAQPSRQPNSKPSAQPVAQPTRQPTSRPSFRPTTQPSGSPTGQPSLQPSSQVTSVPSVQPTTQPSVSPSGSPSTQPVGQPSSSPSVQPFGAPSSQPTSRPTVQPTGRPSGQPTSSPTTSCPTSRPIGQPTGQPTVNPTKQPSARPSAQPVAVPTVCPSSQPSSGPTAQPSAVPTNQPSSTPSTQPSSRPTTQPSISPSCQPSAGPSCRPTSMPSAQPSAGPTVQPSSQPTGCPTGSPSAQPSSSPSIQPSAMPTGQPFGQPSVVPSSKPSSTPSSDPTGSPSMQPTEQPSGFPSSQPSRRPSSQPSISPSGRPSSTPSTHPTGAPSSQPTVQPTRSPSSRPSRHPSAQPSSKPTSLPSCQPSASPTSRPSHRPTTVPSNRPSAQPIGEPTSSPSASPTSQPSSTPSATPSGQPSSHPTSQPTGRPSGVPSADPSAQPLSLPSALPTGAPTSSPSGGPSSQPTSSPSLRPSAQPSSSPSCRPSARPSGAPSVLPSGQPTSIPSVCPTAQPTTQPSSLPSAEPTVVPSSFPVSRPTTLPSIVPISQPSYSPTSTPSVQPSGFPSASPSSVPSAEPSSQPSRTPTVEPTSLPTSAPTTSPPTSAPTIHSKAPSPAPSCSPSCIPTMLPSVVPSLAPQKPSRSPSLYPTAVPTCSPSIAPSMSPSHSPSMDPTHCPSAAPSVEPSVLPSAVPTMIPSVAPTEAPTALPSIVPSISPSTAPSVTPSLAPSALPSAQPTSQPSSHPSQLVIADVFTVGVQLSATTIVESVDYLNYVTVNVATNVPTRGLSLQLQLLEVDSEGGVIRTATSMLIPYVFNLSSLSSSAGKSSSFKLTSSLSRLTMGEYKLMVSVNGTAVPSNTVTFSNSNGSYSLIHVVSSSVPLAAPSLLSATYASDGSYLQISFSGETNRGSTQSKFACSSLFSFTCAATSTCTWQDDSSVLATIAGASAAGISACARPGAPLSLSSAASVKAKCRSSCSAASLWPNAATGIAVEIGLPFVKQAPVVTINANDVIGSCASLLLDLTPSSGNGGRDWNSTAIVVTSTSNVTALMSFLHSSNFTLFPPTRIPAGYFAPDFSYSFQVTLCNFLGSCGTASKTVLVRSTLVPSVSIPGTAMVTVKRKDGLAVTVLSGWPKCDGAAAMPSLVVSWTIKNNSTGVLLNALSTSKDQSKFTLAPYALQVGVTYWVTATAYPSSNASVFATAFMHATVASGDLVAVIAGSASKGIRVRELLKFDASGSYDEDVPAVNASLGLKYEWSCVQTSPNISSSCAALFVDALFVSSKTSAVVQVKALNSTAIAGATALLTVTIQDATMVRSAQTSIKLTVLPWLAPSIQLTSSFDSTVKVNAVQSAYLIGKVDVPAQLVSGDVLWSLDASSGAVLSNVALGATNSTLITGTAAQSLTFYLPLNMQRLPAGVVLLFALTCSLQVGSVPYTSTAAISFTVNSPPLPGLFTVSPSSGEQLSTPFAFACSNWLDEDLPLTYQFGFMSLSGSAVVLRSRLLTAFADLTLGAGPAFNGNMMSVFGQAFDSLLANNTAITQVKVTQGQTANVVTSYVLQALSGSSTSNDVEGIKAAAAISSYLLNSINCTMSVNCSALNRAACYRTAHTCGPCLSDAFLGDDGDSNGACVLPTVNVIGTTNKTCPSACSGHGECLFTSVVTGQAVGACFTGDLTCKAYCQCDGQYTGLSCGITEAEVAAKQVLREQVLQGLQRLAELEDADGQSLQALSNNIASASQAPEELSVQSSFNVLSIASYVFTQMQSTQVSGSTTNSLLDAVQAVLTASGMVAGRRRRLSAEESATTQQLLNQSQAVLQQFVSYMADNMAPGQDPQTSIQSSFRVHVSKFDADSLAAASSVSLAIPKKPSEAKAGVQTGSISLPWSASSNASSFSVSAVYMAGDLYGNSIGDATMQSNPLSLSLSSFPCQSTTCLFQFTMSRQQYYATTPHDVTKAEVFNVTCAPGSHATTAHTCLSDGQQHTVTCRGVAEKLQSVCPLVSYLPTCSALIGSASVDYGCTMIAFTEDNVTCSCPLVKPLLPGSAVHGLHHSIAAANSTLPSGSISISYVALLSTVASSFTSTILTADNLSAKSIGKGYQALATIGVFAAAVLSAMWYSNKADELASKVESEEAAKAKHGKKVKKQGTFMKSVQKLYSNGSQKEALRKKRKKIKEVMENKEKRGFLAIADEALPAVLHAKSLPTVIREELKHHHRWFGVVFHYSDKYPRVLRVASLATNIIVMLFMQSMTYSLTNGDDGSCERNSTELTCLEAKSAFATGESKCYWTPMDTVNVPASDLGCHYVQPNNSIKVVLFVAIFSALVSTPIALLADYVINKVLGAPTRTAVDDLKDKLPAEHSHSLASISPAPSSTDLAVRRPSGRNQVIQEQFDTLVHCLKVYLQQLTEDSDKNEFKQLWGLDDEGNFTTHKQSQGLLKRLFAKSSASHKDGVAAMIFEDLQSVQRTYQEVNKAFNSKKHPLSMREKSKRLLFLFQKDLLPGISGQILESKDSRDNGQVKTVSRSAKRMAWAFLFLLDVGMLFYIFLFAVSQDMNRQSAWFQSFAVWLVAEIFIISTCMVLLMNVAVPAIIMKDVKQIKQKLVDSLVRYHQQISKESGESKQDQEGAFNAAEYLFVSHRLAKTFSDLKTAQIIAQYHTVWPRQSYQHVVDVSQSYNRRFTALTRSASIVVLFFVSNLLTVPMSIQDMVMQMVSTAVTGYTFLIHIQLFQIFPVLVIIPTLLLAVIAHFLLQSHRKHQADSLQALLKTGSKYAKDKSKDKAKDGNESSPVKDSQENTVEIFQAESSGSSDDESESSSSSSSEDSDAKQHGRRPKQSSTGSSGSNSDEDDSGDEIEEKEAGSSSGDESDAEDSVPLHEPLPEAIFSSSSSSDSEGSSDDEQGSDEEADEFVDLQTRAAEPAVTREHATRRASLQQGVSLLQQAQLTLGTAEGAHAHRRR